MPRLAVVMAARNANQTVVAAVRSTLAAMPRDATLTVWDDGSDDGTADRVEALGSRRVTVLRSKTSVGSGEGRRRAVAATDSEYVANIDADDLSLPWRFAVQLPRLRTVDASFATTVRFDGRVRSARWSGGYGYRPEEAAVALVVHNVLPHSTMVLRRSALERAGGYRPLRVAQDYDLWLRLVASGARIERLRVPTAAYRQSAGQISRTADYHARANEQPELRQAWADAVRTVLAVDVQPGAGGLEVVQRASLSALGALTGAKKQAYYRQLVESGTTFQLLPPA